MQDISLDPRSKYAWCENKDDISVKQIFECQEGTSSDRAHVAKYCVQDCALVSRLLSKLDILSNNIAMANVCCVPLSYLFLRGQGIKVFSLVAQQTRRNNYILPVIKPPAAGFDDEEHIREGFEGAIVLEPKTDLWYEGVSVADFSSLYPSSMISRNLSHESFVSDPHYLTTPGIEFERIEYDNYEYVRAGSSSKFTKRINPSQPKKISIFAQPRKNQSGVVTDESRGMIPRILLHLLNARKQAKSMMSRETDPFKKSLYSGLQLAYKVVANSVRLFECFYS